jgi:hypothetical protein
MIELGARATWYSDEIMMKGRNMLGIICLKFNYAQDTTYIQTNKNEENQTILV